MTAFKHCRKVTLATEPNEKDILINGGGASDIDILFGDTTIINGGGASGIEE